MYVERDRERFEKSLFFAAFYLICCLLVLVLDLEAPLSVKMLKAAVGNVRSPGRYAFSFSHFLLSSSSTRD